MPETKQYKCHKVVSARPMKRGAYYDYKEMEKPVDLNAESEGYLVIYSEGTSDHYESWSPKKQFDEGYTLIPEQSEPQGIMRYFEFKHLPPKLQTISQPIGELAALMNATLPDGPEKSAGLRKLLEAKDCLVRAHLN